MTYVRAALNLYNCEMRLARPEPDYRRDLTSEQDSRVGASVAVSLNYG
jgi:hypothetical protein